MEDKYSDNEEPKIIAEKMEITEEGRKIGFNEKFKEIIKRRLISPGENMNKRACGKIGLYQIISGCILIICNLTGIILPKRDELKYACFFSGGFICGVSAIVAGILGMSISKKNDNKYMLTGCFVSSVLTLISAIYVISLGVFGLKICYSLNIDELDVFILIYIVYEVIGLTAFICSAVQCHLCFGGSCTCIDETSPPKPSYLETTAVAPPVPAVYGIELPCTPSNFYYDDH